jgi:phosphoribosylanthranilate isomerase
MTDATPHWTRIKICGLTNLEDAQAAIAAGADYLGFIFYDKSPRYVSPPAYAAFARDLPDSVKKVGVFVNAELSVIAGLFDQYLIDYVQFSGDEPSELVGKLGAAYKAVRPATLDEYHKLAGAYIQQNDVVDPNLPAMLIDTYHPNLYGGTGQQMSRELAIGAGRHNARLMFAGGLNPENVGEFVAAVRPFAVDVASGVEASPGKKDHGKVRAFVQAVRGIER